MDLPINSNGLGAAVFLKSLNLAKSRLDHLTPAMRTVLAIAMAEDLLAAIIASAIFDKVILVSSDPLARQLADTYRVEHIEEVGGGGLNCAAGEAVACLGRRGIQRAVLVPADMPLVRAATLRRVVLVLDHAMNCGADLGLVPCRNEDGTNLLMCDVARSPRFQYGQSSFSIHVSQAKSPALHRDPEIGFDIDRQEDLVELAQVMSKMARPPRHTAAAIDKMDRRHAA